MRGTGFGVIRTVAFSLGATSPLLFGAADRGFFDEAFLLLAVFTAGMLVVGWRLPTD